MIRITSLQLPLGHDDGALLPAIAARLGVDPSEIASHSVFKRSYDARRRNAVKVIYTVDVEVAGEDGVLARLAADDRVRPAPDMIYRAPVAAAALAGRAAPRPVVIGMGPCGIFAGLLLAQWGLRPLILERGKKARERTVDTFGFWRGKGLDPESNVQFGEGGAGTFSDGKLYSQIRDPRHLGRKVLTELVASGARPEILYESRPHIGTYRLVKILENLRARIEALGGEIRFQTRVDRLLIDDGAVRGLRLRGGEELCADRVVLAVGHSARDTFEMLRDCGVHVEPKPFSIGFRIEHPQKMIDARRYGRNAGHPWLGAADYRLSHHCRGTGLQGRSVYTFCMCPGGMVVAAASEPGGVVTNGMSQHDRAESNANSGIVVDLAPEIDFPGDALAGVAFQRHYEALAFAAGGGTYEAPGQLVGDFLAGRSSSTLGAVSPSYTPGVRLGDLSGCLPEFAIAAIREALPAFDRKLRGFARDDAVLTGVETRTSVADPHPPRRGRAERQHPRPVPGGRRRRLRGRHPVGGRRRHPRRRGGGAGDPVGVSDRHPAELRRPVGGRQARGPLEPSPLTGRPPLPALRSGLSSAYRHPVDEEFGDPGSLACRVGRLRLLQAMEENRVDSLGHEQRQLGGIDGS